MAEVERRNAGVEVGYARFDAPRATDIPDYEVIVDRISHEVPCYQPFLKVAKLRGSRIINDPFFRIADDKFFDVALADTLGVAVPKTVLLPSKDYESTIDTESLQHNMGWVDWEKIERDLAFPMYIKPHWGGGWRAVTRVASMSELLSTYDNSGRYTMILQEEIQWTQYVRCIVIGRQHVLPALWDPRLSHFERYRHAHRSMPALDRELEARVSHDALKLTRALGYDMNTVEFAISNGVPFAIDFMNSAPDFDITSLGESHFRWTVEKMADLVVDAAKAPRADRPRWHELLPI